MRRLTPVIIGLVFIGITLYLSVYFEDTVKKAIARTDLSWVISTILLRIVISVAFARGAQLICTVFLPKLKPLLTFVIAVPIGFAISFITPIYDSDYGDFSSEGITIDHGGLTNLTDGKYQVRQEPYLLVFFLKDCKHCKQVSKLLGFAQSIGNTPPIEVVFPGRDSSSREFIKMHSGSRFNYYTINDSEFFLENSGAWFPSIYLIDTSGQTIAHWNEVFNYTALDYIESYSK